MLLTIVPWERNYGVYTEYSRIAADAHVHVLYLTEVYIFLILLIACGRDNNNGRLGNSVFVVEATAAIKTFPVLEHLFNVNVSAKIIHQNSSA